jgi:Arc/MetJ-type ribon-helix-helix transcriptional regulator
MGETITFRVDAETARILRELRKRDKTSNSEVIRTALRSHWREVAEERRPTSWEVYQELYSMLPPPREGQPLHDRARHVSRLFKEKLLAKRREGTL